jgi:hypothetical protein
MTVYLLNTPILTDWGMYIFTPLSLSQVIWRLGIYHFVSAIGHEGTANLLSRLTDVSIPVNRVPIKMTVGDMAIVFRLLTRLPEGKVLSEEELKQLPYEFGMLRKVD